MRRYGSLLLIAAMVTFACLLAHLITGGNRSIAGRLEVARRELLLLRKENDGRSLSDLPWLTAQLNADKNVLESIVSIRTRPELSASGGRIGNVGEFADKLTVTFEKLRALAKKFKVALRGDGYFGFTDILQRGHVGEAIANRDYGELLEIAALLQLLFESSSGDLYFIGVERESVLQRDLTTCRNDFFDGTAVPSVRQLLAVDSHIFRLRFRSKTDTFRNFMNAIEDNLMPVVPHNIIISSPKAAQRGATAQSVVVNSYPAEFSIVMEWVHVPKLEENDSVLAGKGVRRANGSREAHRVHAN
ncbi:MAG: hypothetical protein LBI39_04500 [Puniceicoccales bacterium]|jgi:hypothetical protein|nr:hypothetical protein [Puniceicoccales bacterium]